MSEEMICAETTLPLLVTFMGPALNCVVAMVPCNVGFESIALVNVPLSASAFVPT